MQGELSTTLGLASPCASLRDAVDIVSRRVALLNENSLNILEGRLLSLASAAKDAESNGKMSTEVSGASSVEVALSASFSDICALASVPKLRDLYATTQRWQALVDTIPALVARLRTLQHLHERERDRELAVQQVTEGTRENRAQLETMRAQLTKVGIGRLILETYEAL